MGLYLEERELLEAAEEESNRLLQRDARQVLSLIFRGFCHRCEELDGAPKRFEILKDETAIKNVREDVLRGDQRESRLVCSENLN